MKKQIHVLFVCLGNICRSPAAEGAFRNAVEKRNLDMYFRIDSAGTAGYHIGELAHEITRQVAKDRGIYLTHKSRKFETGDFEEFDYILAMDSSNYQNILRLAGSDLNRKKVMKFRKFDPVVKSGEPDVPDPYYGGISEFEHVQDIAERTSEKLLDWIISQEELLSQAVKEK